jgi:RNA polymerase sigma factor (sigma-70 family)
MSITDAQVPYQRFYREQAPAVARFLTGMLGPDDAEECLQETFLSALRAFDRFDGRNPRAWVLAIARRKAIDTHRARSRRPLPIADAGDAAPARDPELLDSAIWAEVADLPGKQRAALVLRYALDLRHREIGAVLGCSEAAARRNVHEGIVKLRARHTEEVA